MPVTALIGAALCVIFKVADAKTVFAPFADPLMFLFIGSFILARAIFLHDLDKRFAYGVLSLKIIGARPSRILFAFGAVTAFASAWISNTATTAMMFAIGLSIIAFLFKHEKETGIKINRNYATAMMLITSFAASIGGLATPIGTPPNVIGLGFIRRILEVEIPFFKWMMIGAPIVIVLYIFLYLYLNYLAPAGVKEIPGSAEMIQREKAELGKWTRAQKSTVFAFATAVVLWIFSGLVALFAGETSAIYKAISSRLPEAVGAIVGAVLLFLLPGNKPGERAITWHEAVKIDWGVILLYGGGFALGVLSFHTGLGRINRQKSDRAVTSQRRFRFAGRVGHRRRRDFGNDFQYGFGEYGRAGCHCHRAGKRRRPVYSRTRRNLRRIARIYAAGFHAVQRDCLRFGLYSFDENGALRNSAGYFRRDCDYCNAQSARTVSALKRLVIN